MYTILILWKTQQWYRPNNFNVYKLLIIFLMLKKINCFSVLMYWCLCWECFMCCMDLFVVLKFKQCTQRLLAGLQCGQLTVCCRRGRHVALSYANSRRGFLSVRFKLTYGVTQLQTVNLIFTDSVSLPLSRLHAAFSRYTAKNNWTTLM